MRWLFRSAPREPDALARWGAARGLKPPVALLGYATDDPRRAAFWPFAVFSPEWQAIRWAVGRGVPVRFFDLPYAYRLTAGRRLSVTPETEPEGPPGAEAGEPAAPLRPVDPIGELAAAA